MRVTAVILAAGHGHRMGGSDNKTFLPIAGQPLLAYGLRAFATSPRIDEIIMVVAPDEEDRVRGMLPPAVPSISFVPGGDVRRDSSIAGVEAATGEIVLIHDGARPFPSPELIERVIRGAVEHGACAPVLPVADTLRPIADDGLLVPDPVDRRGLVRIQTPQGFRASLIRRALPLSAPDITDDAGAVLALGEEVWGVTGEPTNLKVTFPGDLPLAEAIAQRLQSRNAL